MKLTEITQQVDLNEIKKILDKYKIKNYTINADGTVDVDGNVDFSNKSITSIPVQFRNVTRHFYCYGTKITSLEGAPQSVGGNFYCSTTKITSLAGCPQSVGGDFNCSFTEITSLSGVHKQIKHVGFEFFIPTNTTHLLGLLLIPGIKQIRVFENNQVSKILNKHLKDKNVLLAQDELIDAGYPEQAKL